MQAGEAVMETVRFLYANERDQLAQFLSLNGSVEGVIAEIERSDGRPFLVGGAVRDLLLGRELKDLDIEVHGVSLTLLSDILKKFGEVFEVGRSFGVLRVSSIPQSDWSLPRTDGSGRKPHVKIDPEMGIVPALRRRDLTMNALAIDLITHELIDPFCGEQDIKDHILRCTDPEIFIEDPLRLFRVMQFVGRFEMEPDPILNETCRSMGIKGVSAERIENEFEKLFLLSRRPSLGIRWLEKIGRLSEILPELAPTVEIPQNPKWHPEGVVFEHTMQVLDAAAREELLPRSEKLVLMYAALCHDLGKVVTTTTRPDGRLTSHGHEVESAPLAKTLLRRFVGSKELVNKVERLVRWHMAPLGFVVNNAKSPAYKKLALLLAPDLSISFLTYLARADMSGRNGDSSQPLSLPLPGLEKFIERADAAGVLYGPEKALIKGQDLKEFFNIGPQIGKAVKRAYEIQINEEIADKTVLLKRVLKEFGINGNFSKQ